MPVVHPTNNQATKTKMRIAGASPGCVTGGRAGLLLADGNGLMIECQRIRQLTVLFADAAQSQPDPEAVPWLRITGEQRQGAAETSFSLARQILLQGDPAAAEQAFDVVGIDFDRPRKGGERLLRRVGNVAQQAIGDDGVNPLRPRPGQPIGTDGLEEACRGGKLV